MKSNSEAAMRGRQARKKGHDLERWVATQLRSWFPDAKRGIQSRSGSEASDVEGTPFHVECKAGKSVSVRAALRQADDDTDGRPVVVVVKDHGDGTPWVAMPWATFRELLEKSE